MKYLIILTAVATTVISYAQEEPTLVEPTIPTQQEESPKKEVIEADLFQEIEPEFPGGQAALNLFISENIVYPEISIENGEEGTVYISLIVRKDGSIDEVKALRSPFDALKKEAIRCVKLMPNWIPGKMDGKPIDARAFIPIVFNLDNKEKNTINPPIEQEMEPERKPVSNDEIVTFPDIEPKFGEDNLALRDYVQEHIIDPINERGGDKVIYARASLVIEKDGSISEVTVKNIPDESIKEEVIKTFKEMPNWTPGQKGGEVVRTKYNFGFRLFEK